MITVNDVLQAHQLCLRLEDKQAAVVQDYKLCESDDKLLLILRLDYLITSAYQRLARRASRYKCSVQEGFFDEN
jgi:RNA binding exosome subunit